MPPNKEQAKPTRVTAADVAAHAGVSQSTVSRVLNGRDAHFISAKTRGLVLEAAERLGYRPDPIARALRSRRTNLLGLIVREIDDPFFAQLIAELSNQARALDYHLVLGHAHSDPAEALQMTGFFDTRRCDGVLVLGDLRNDEAALRQMLDGNRAIVGLCRGPYPSPIARINSDSYTGVRLLIDHLQELGHRCFAFIHGGWLGDIQARRDAFVELVTERNLTIRPEWIQSDVNDAAGGYRSMQRLLAASPRPSAVLAADDMIAVGALKAAQDAGLTAPRDISVVGFDDIELARYFSPALTTVRQPVEDLCRHALHLILKLVNKGQIAPSDRFIQLPPALMVRDSSGPAPAETAWRDC